MTGNKVWTWDELDQQAVTNLFWYGKETTPLYYVERFSQNLIQRPQSSSPHSFHHPQIL